MSKFKTLSPRPLAPPVDDLSLEAREAKLAALSRAANAELMLRLKHQILLRVLAAIETLEAAPKDWRSRLRAVEDVTRLFVGDEDEADEDEEG